jgi:hypothetical protein
MMNPVPVIFAMVVGSPVDPWVGEIDSTENGCGLDGTTGDLSPQPSVMTTAKPRLGMPTRAKELRRI